MSTLSSFRMAYEGGYQVITRADKSLGFNSIEIYNTVEDFINDLGHIEDLDIRSFYKQNKNGRYYLTVGHEPELEIELI